MIKLLRNCANTHMPKLFQSQVDRLNNFYDKHITAINSSSENRSQVLIREQAEARLASIQKTQQLQRKVIAFNEFDAVSNMKQEESIVLEQWAFLDDMDQHSLLEMDQLIKDQTERFQPRTALPVQLQSSGTYRKQPTAAHLVRESLGANTSMPILGGRGL